MFLHVYWLFCQMAHQDAAEWTRCLPESAGATNGVPDVESKSSAMNGSVGGVEARPPWDRRATASANLAFSGFLFIKRTQSFN